MFNEKRLLDRVAYGSSYGHSFNTRVVSLRSGVEARNANWSMPLGQYSVIFRNLRREHHEQVIAAHRACFGQLIGFRLRDWSDYQATEQLIGTGTGAEQQLQLVKHYDFGPLQFTRKIAKPVEGSITVKAAGVEVAALVDSSTGVLTITANPGDPITWSGLFDVPVRFANDDISFEVVDKGAGGFFLTSDVELQEIRL